MNEPLHLTASQKKAAERLDFFWRIKRSGSSRVGSTETRSIPLLVGPSGAGKTASIRDFATRHGLPLFSISAGVWIVRGAKNDVLTTDAMAAWITEIWTLERQNAAPICPASRQTPLGHGVGWAMTKHLFVD